MNEQKAASANHIEWTRIIRPDGTRTKGYTFNPIAGCQHGCRWQMPDGKIAECYAENVAENVALKSYPFGFEHHYWKPQLLDKPAKVKEGAGIFIGSMADVFGAWVPDEQIAAVLDVCRNTPQHIYFVLTKNAPRLLKFEFPDNVWVGASSPPDFMFSKPLSLEQREAMLRRTLKVLSEVKAKERWMSIEPLSHDYSAIFREYPTALTWAVIGAASDGKRKFPPSEQDLVNTLMALDVPGIPIFYKGNMRSLPYAAAHWREGFPGVPTTERLVTSPALPTIPHPGDDLEALRAGSDERIADTLAELVSDPDPDPIPPAPITKAEPDYADPFDLPLNAKVITLQQPYASAVMAGVKQIETRSWKTPYRGAIVIHAGKAWNDDLKEKANSELIASALRSKGLDPNNLPLGMALGVVILDAVTPIENVLPSLSDTEKALGHYTDGNFAWCVSRPRPFREPLPGEGGLGLRDWSSYLAKIGQPVTLEGITAPVEADAAPVTTVANFNHVYQHWNKATRTWDDPKFVYIGRYMPSFNLPSSIFANPFKIAKDTTENRAAAIEQYRGWIKSKLSDPVEGERYRTELEALRGKTLVCFCKPKPCHGDTLLSLLGEEDQIVVADEPVPEKQSEQLSLFDVGEITPKRTFAY